MNELMVVPLKIQFLRNKQQRVIQEDQEAMNINSISKYVPNDWFND